MYIITVYFSNPGKTLLAKAVANQTSATFLRVCGSELIQKYQVNHMIHLHISCSEQNDIPLCFQELWLAHSTCLIV